MANHLAFFTLRELGPNSLVLELPPPLTAILLCEVHVNVPQFMPLWVELCLTMIGMMLDSDFKLYLFVSVV